MDQTPASIVRSHGDNPTWVSSPMMAGDNLPPSGRSLFDQLLMKRKGDRYVYDVPFPFDTLTQRIREVVRTDADRPALKQILIPLGRSLQRNASAPEFFRYPRAVVAVDGEADRTLAMQGQSAGLLLKDRLYLGYQEKTNIIEVISYNEAAGRFEFQIVKDYRAGGDPKIFYANRAVCLSCHQNAAPLFSRQVWDETNANPKIAALLHRQQRDFYGINIDRGIDVPYAIDNAVDRANLFAVYQMLWRDGCGTADAASIRCRSALFTALLQYKLSGDRQFDHMATRYQQQVADRIAAIGSQRWPAGLAIGNPDIPNRDPIPGERGLNPPDDLLAATANPSNSEARRLLADLSNITPSFDPLTPRPPLEIWTISRSAQVARVVTGLSGFIADADIARLDARLAERAIRQPIRRYRGDCRMTEKVASPKRRRIDFTCTPSQVNTDSAMTVTGHLQIEGTRVLDGAIDRLQLGNQELLQDMDLLASAIKISNGKRQAALRFSRGNSRVRGADGNLIEKIELAWPMSPTIDSGVAVVDVREDFALVEGAVSSMTEAAMVGRFDGFNAQPFRRASLMPALFSRLGMQPLQWCCTDDRAMPPVMVEHTPQKATDVTGDVFDPNRSALQLFYRHCATCHQTPNHTPPNFLVGSRKQVNDNLEQCAERLFVRLSMWQLVPGAQQKTPMPPMLAIQGEGYSLAAWRDGDELPTLKRYVENVLKKQTGKTPQLNDLVKRGYENLRPCLSAVE